MRKSSKGEDFSQEQTAEGLMKTAGRTHQLAVLEAQVHAIKFWLIQGNFLQINYFNFKEGFSFQFNKL